jgi:hypothetical protein
VAPDSSLTIGQRLYLIRLACGDGVRKPESAADFSKRVEKATGQRYDQATISRLETGGRNWLLEDVDAFARVDPEGRGRAWLAGYADADMGKDAAPGRMPRTLDEVPEAFIMPKVERPTARTGKGRRRRA